MKGAAFSGITLHIYFSEMIFHNLSAYCQTYAVARIFIAHMQPLKDSENFVQMRLLHADPIVPETDLPEFFFGHKAIYIVYDPGADIDHRRHFFPSVFNGIGDQVGEELPHLYSGTLYDGQIGKMDACRTFRDA